MMLLYIGIYYYFPSHIKYFGSHIPKVPTKLQQLASTALNFDTVRILADFPLAYKHSNLNLDIAIWCNPGQNLQLKLLSETGNKPIHIK